MQTLLRIERSDVLYVDYRSFSLDGGVNEVHLNAVVRTSYRSHVDW